MLSQREAYPVHLFCQQGKDRTGLIVLLVELLCDVPVDTIKQDYMLSEGELKPERKERLEELEEMGLPVAFAGCDPGLVSSVTEWLEKEHGGVRGYMNSIGVKQDMQTATRQILVDS